ncbi:MAG: SEC-C metal-binding domain-containing protein [Planctomycetota bacterium]
MVRTDSDVLTQYDTFKEIADGFLSGILEWVDEGMLEAGARRLGLWHDGRVAYQVEAEMAALLDYCVYHLPKEGLNLAARYLRRHPPLPGSDEEIVLKAMAHARYAVLKVNKPEPGVGVECCDVLRGTDLFIPNRAMSTTAQKGTLLASTLLALPDFDICTGAALPVFREAADDITRVLINLAPRMPACQDHLDDPSVAHELATGIIRACLCSGAAEYVRHIAPPIPETLRAPVYTYDDLLDGLGFGGPASRNRPCPCGSGMKYKRCCGALKRW